MHKDSNYSNSPNPVASLFASRRDGEEVTIGADLIGLSTPPTAGVSSATSPRNGISATNEPPPIATLEGSGATIISSESSPPNHEGDPIAASSVSFDAPQPSAVRDVVVATDPSGAKLVVAAHHTAVTKAIARDKRTSPTVCLLFQRNECKQNRRCHQLHVCTPLVSACRAALADTDRGLCCGDHTACHLQDVPSLPISPDGATFKVMEVALPPSHSCVCEPLVSAVSVPSGLLVAIPPLTVRGRPYEVRISDATLAPQALLYTRYLARLLLSAAQHLDGAAVPPDDARTDTTVVIDVPPNKICLNHAGPGKSCRFGDDCKYLHACRLRVSHLLDPMSDVVDNDRRLYRHCPYRGAVKQWLPSSPTGQARSRPASRGHHHSNSQRRNDENPH